MLRLGCISLVIFLLSSTIDLSQAQQRETPQKTGQDPNRTTTQDSQRPGMPLQQPLVGFFAAKMVLCNNGEIELGTWAAGKASNQEVRQFAETMIKDHAQANQELSRFVSDYSIRPLIDGREGGTTSQPAGDRGSTDLAKGKTDQQPVTEPSKQNPPSSFPTVRAQQETSLRTDAASSSLREVYDICRVAHDYHLDHCKEMLGNLSGVEFDKAYMGSQVGAHVAVLAELEALETRSTGEFQQFVKEAKGIVKGHLEKAKEICKSMDSTTAGNQRGINDR